MAGKRGMGNGMGVPVALSEDKWRAESDARTLAEAEVIKADSKRFKAAQKAAKEMARSKKVEADSMMQIASGGKK